MTTIEAMRGRYTLGRVHRYLAVELSDEELGHWPLQDAEWISHAQAICDAMNILADCYAAIGR